MSYALQKKPCLPRYHVKVSRMTLSTASSLRFALSARINLSRAVTALRQSGSDEGIIGNYDRGNGQFADTYNRLAKPGN